MSIFIADIHSKEAIKGNEFSFKGPFKRYMFRIFNFRDFYVRSVELQNSVLLAKNKNWVHQRKYDIPLNDFRKIIEKIFNRFWGYLYNRISTICKISFWMCRNYFDDYDHWMKYIYTCLRCKKSWEMFLMREIHIDKLLGRRFVQFSAESKVVRFFVSCTLCFYINRIDGEWPVSLNEIQFVVWIANICSRCRV